MIADRLRVMEPLKGTQIIMTGSDLQPVCTGVGPLQTAVYREEVGMLMANLSGWFLTTLTSL